MQTRLLKDCGDLLSHAHTAFLTQGPFGFRRRPPSHGYDQIAFVSALLGPGHDSKLLPWYSQDWKTDTEMCERSGRPDVTSWRTTRESQPGFSHEETQHDGTAQSVVNEGIPRERSGRPDVDPENQGHNNLSLETMKQT